MAAKKKKPKKPSPNLTPWKPGQSGNPKGRPPGVLSLTASLKEVASWPVPPSVLKQYQTLFPALPNNATCVQVLAVRNMVKAMDIKTGDVMAKEIWERIDGKVPLPIGGDPNGTPIPIKHDFSGMSTKELDIFERLLQKCQQTE